MKTQILLFMFCLSLITSGCDNTRDKLEYKTKQNSATTNVHKPQTKSDIPESIVLVKRFFDEAWKKTDLKIIDELVTQNFINGWNDEQYELVTSIFQKYELSKVKLFRVIEKNDIHEIVLAHIKFSNTNNEDTYGMLFTIIKKDNQCLIHLVTNPITAQIALRKARQGSVDDCISFLSMFPDDVNTSEVLMRKEKLLFENEKKINKKIFDEILSGKLTNYDELTCLTPEVAQKLLKYNQSLHFNNLKYLDPESTRVLAKFEGMIYFDGLTSISVEVAREIGKYECQSVILDGLKSISIEIVRELAKFEGYDLSLDGLTSITVKIARELGNSQAGLLFLSGLTKITADIARELVKFQGFYLELNGLTNLTKEIAIILAQFSGDLSLDGIKSISVEVARELSNVKGDISLNGLTSISDDVARQLGNHKGPGLYLNGLKTISEVAAIELAKHESIEACSDVMNKIEKYHTE